jgi:hypothetical protein
MPLYHVYISKTLKQKQQSKWPANSFKENKKESTLQNQPKYHLNCRGPSLIFFLFLLDRALSRSQAHPMQYPKAEKHPNKREKGLGGPFRLTVPHKGGRGRNT